MLIVIVLFKYSTAQQKIDISSIYGREYTVVVGDRTEKIVLKKESPILLDFGANYCPPCLASLIKMDSLKTKYGDKLQMIMVMKQTLEVVKNAKAKNSVIRNINIPIIVGDSLLNKLFEHQTEPHLVWIDRGGVFVGATSQYSLDDKSLSGFINTGVMEGVSKTDKKFDYRQGIRSILRFKDGYTADPDNRIHFFLPIWMVFSHGSM